MMTADEVIDSYVRDVAANLPRGKRNDVAFELSALLGDELGARSAAAGRAPDNAMAMDLLKGFGRPAEAARRYHERPAIIEPTDTPHFLIWAIAGAVVLNVLVALNVTGGPIDSAPEFLKWLGILVICFGVAGWWRRLRPNAFTWRPSRRPDWISRWSAMLQAAALLIFPVAMYAAPQTFAEIAFLNALPADGVALTTAFAGSWLRFATLALLLASVALFAALAVQGGWRRWSRWASLVIDAGLASAFLIHAAPVAAPDGTIFEVFATAAANKIATPIFSAIGALYVLGLLYELYRLWDRVRPAPQLKGAAA